MYHKITLYTLSSFLVIGSVAGVNGTIARAFSDTISRDDFNPGRIIDNDVFTDTTTMTVDSIQTFLEDHVTGGECNRYKENPYSTGDTPPYTCLFEFQQNPETGENNYGLFTEDGAPATVEGGLSAAQIIYDAAQEYDINPQVLLVLLQKEQSLVTDNWPWRQQYSKATGYLCPDDAPCDANRADFYKQVAGAAWQFRRYLDQTDLYWYTIGENNVLYHPNTSCGYATVNIENTATIALYLYTPYTPNEAALNNLYGKGDNCSAYGNRNFWTYFTHWFGPTTSGQALPAISETTDETVADEPVVEETDSRILSFNATRQSFYADAAHTDYLGSNRVSLKTDQTVYGVFEFENTGDTTWEATGRNQIMLSPTGSTSRVCHGSWRDNCQHIATVAAAVDPQTTGRFEFELQTPDSDIAFVEFFTLRNNMFDLDGETISVHFDITSGTPAPAPQAPVTPTETDTTDEATPVAEVDTTPVADDTPADEPTAELTTTPVALNVLPENWHSLSVMEKVRLNPFGCNPRYIRADNGRCVDGSEGTYRSTTRIALTRPAVPTTPVVETPADDVEPETTTPALMATNVIVLPENWHSLSVMEKVRLNPFGCNPRYIRADNGRCVDGSEGTYRSTTRIALTAPNRHLL